MNKENDTQGNEGIECRDTDTLHEGKDKAFLDVDRMINEGLAGGSVHMKGSKTNIEESRELEQEEKPYTIE